MRDLIFQQPHPNDPMAWEALRTLRNGCAQYMTDFQGEITPEDQQKFKASLHPSDQVWLVRHVSGPYIGFIYIRGADVTYGIEKSWRGRGYGKELVTFSQRVSSGLLSLKVLKTNTRAIMLYEKSGFKHIDVDDKSYYMEWERR